MAEQYVIRFHPVLRGDEKFTRIIVGVDQLPSKIEGMFSNLEVDVRVSDWPASYEEAEAVAKRELKELLETVLAGL